MKTKKRYLRWTMILCIVLPAFTVLIRDPNLSELPSGCQGVSEQTRDFRHVKAVSGHLPESQAGSEPAWEKKSFTSRTREIVHHLSEGKAVTLQVEGIPDQRFRFRPARVTTEDFVFTDGANHEIPMDFAVFQGRSFSGDQPTTLRAVAVAVGKEIVYSFNYQGHSYSIHSGNENREAYAQRTELPEPECNGGGSGNHASCQNHSKCTHLQDGVVSVSAPEFAPLKTSEIAAKVVLENQTDESDDSDTVIYEQLTGHPHFSLGQEYDASLVDLPIIWVVDPTVTGSSAQLEDTAAFFLSQVALVVDIYERQLGLRPILQELMIIPNDIGYPNLVIEESHGQQMGDFRAWISNNRPQGTYKWGHIALWTDEVGDASVLGVAHYGEYGNSGRGFSLNEPVAPALLFGHEFGHSVGANHAWSGIMVGFGFGGGESFYKQTVATGSQRTVAQEIYLFLTNDSDAAKFQFGPAALRNAEEIPFAVDDFPTTAQGVALAFNPLLNDETSVLYGATNTLSLVEVGSVFPRGAGTAEVFGDEIIFTPSASYTGNAWMTYTMRGSVGNNGEGWMHSADIVLTVGGNNSDPSLNPDTSLEADVYLTDFTSPFRFNPLLNDHGSGYRSPGDIDVATSPGDTTAETYSGQSFHLVNAVIVNGPGTLEIETRNVVDHGSFAVGYNGYMTYLPTGSENEVIIQYTIRDANDEEFSSTATLRNDDPIFTFSQWASQYALNGKDQLSDDADDDGIKNGIEALYGTAPDEFSDGSAQLTFDGFEAQLIHPFNANKPEDLTSEYQWSLDLIHWYAADGMEGPTSSNAPKISTEITTGDATRTATFTSNVVLQKVFYRISVSQN